MHSDVLILLPMQTDYISVSADHQASEPESEVLKAALTTWLIMEPLISNGAFVQTALTMNKQAPLT